MAMLSKSSKDSLDSIINFIIESDEYKNCIRLKKKDRVLIEKYVILLVKLNLYKKNMYVVGMMML